MNEPLPAFVKNCLDTISYIPITLSDLRFDGIIFLIIILDSYNLNEYTFPIKILLLVPEELVFPFAISNILTFNGVSKSETGVKLTESPLTVILPFDVFNLYIILYITLYIFRYNHIHIYMFLDISYISYILIYFYI